MRSPAQMRTIQIDITNACTHQCSNCTRFCGHHRKPFFMDMETFRRAVDSLADFPRCVGMMGGEPTLHPQFAQMARYLAEKHPSRHTLRDARKPIADFSRYIYDKNYILDESLNQRQGPGLWTSMVEPYYRHFELIQDVFSFQNINDHQNDSLHQPLLVSRKDLGITDEEWYPLRDRCWVQNSWSATITPKGAFFCEVAGALDMLFDGPGGWKIEPGWWKRTPEEFGDQLRWCEICGGALLNRGRLASEEIDDVSPTVYAMLEKQHSPKLGRGRVCLFTAADAAQGTAMPETSDRYLTDHTERMSRQNRALYPKYFDLASLAGRPNDLPFGIWLNRILSDSHQDWIVLYTSESEQSAAQAIADRLKNMILNPGVCYHFAHGVIFHPRAHALRRIGFDGIAHTQTLEEFLDFWPADKQITLADDFDAFQNPDLVQWKTYVQEKHLENDPQVRKCLQKIQSDYEGI